MLLKIVTSIRLLAFNTKANVSARTLSGVKRFMPLSLPVTAKGPPESAKSKPLDAVTPPPPPNTAIWIKLSGEFGEKVFSVKSDSDGVNIDDLKELVKVKCCPLLNEIDAMMLDVKGADGSVIDEDVLLVTRPEGRKRSDPFFVKVPKTSK